jgi:hypothetical protein
MALNQTLAEFRFNLETLDMMISMGRTSEQSYKTLSELGFNQDLVQFMQNNRVLLNMVLVRLQLYSEQNFSEQKVRSGLSVLNNKHVNVLLDYLFKSSDAPVKTKKISFSPPPTPLVHKDEHNNDDQEEHIGHQEDDDQEDDEQEENYFESFFTAHITHTEDVSDSVKFKEVYSKFSEWWSNNHEDELPSKDELKTFLSSKLEQKISSTVTHIMLN